MRLFTTDLEATCWENDGPFQRENSEIIEIGGVGFNPDTKFEKSIQIYIKPAKHPKLTDYCVKLTGITQETVDAAQPAGEAYLRLYKFLSENNLLKCVMVSWGRYDWHMLRKEMINHGFIFPFRGHINLKDAFAAWEGRKPMGLKRAIESLGWTFEGNHHSGLADAQNTNRILKFLLQQAPHVLTLSKLD